MAEQPSRKRRIVRRAIWSLLAIVLLPVWYVASYCSTAWLVGQGVISTPVWHQMQETVFLPFILYLNADLPGAREIDAMAGSLYERGGKGWFSWDDSFEGFDSVE